MIEHVNGMASAWWSWMLPMLWQTALLAGFVLAVDFFLRRRGWPQVRYVLWLLVLARLAIPPSFALATSLSARLLALKPTSPAVVRTVADPRSSTPVAVMPAPPLSASAARQPAMLAASIPAVSVPLSSKAWAMLASTAVSLFFLCWLVARLFRLRRMAGRASAAPAHIVEALAHHAAQLKLRRLPRVVITDAVPSAAVCGILRPILFLPESYQDLPREQLGHILLHELAHLKRGDLIVNAVQSLLHIVYWFNPVLWLAARRLRHLREICCDATVANLLRERTSDYCVTLVNAADRLSGAGFGMGLGLLGLFEGPARLRQRIEQLARPSWKHRRLRRFTAAALAAIVILCVLPMAPVRVASGADSEDRVVDRIDYPFVDDPALRGEWLTVDFVKDMDDFAPEKKQWRGPDFFLRGMMFLADGGTNVWTEFSFDRGEKPTGWLSWTKGFVIHSGNRTAAHYEIRNIGGKDHLFMEWKSGDYTIRKQKPQYYVFVRLAPEDRVVDKIDQPFVDDSELRGTWEVFDYVESVEGFDPDERQWRDKNSPLAPAQITFDEGGGTSGPWKWTNGLVIEPDNKTAAEYTIKTLPEKTFLFVEWQNDNYLFRGMKPKYLVFMKGGADNRLVDRADYPFVDDPALRGTWTSVDFVKTVEQFNPRKKRWPDNEDLMIQEMSFTEGGKVTAILTAGDKVKTISDWLTWTKDRIIRPKPPVTAAHYEIKTIDRKDYLFFEWKSGDYTIRGHKPQYYVLTRAEKAD
jgi:bla regulator protein BlaR1